MLWRGPSNATGADLPDGTVRRFGQRCARHSDATRGIECGTVAPHCRRRRRRRRHSGGHGPAVGCNAATRPMAGRLFLLLLCRLPTGGGAACRQMPSMGSASTYTAKPVGALCAPIPRRRAADLRTFALGASRCMRRHQGATYAARQMRWYTRVRATRSITRTAGAA